MRIERDSDLWQKQSDNKIRLITFGKRFLNDAEKKHPIEELEILAVVWELEEFFLHLYGKVVYL